MATGDQLVFKTNSPIPIAPSRLVALALGSTEHSAHVHYEPETGVVFDTDGWYEVLMRVDWDPADTFGSRFAHTRIPDQEPLHSEAIDASVLARISSGRQLLRGNSLFGPDRTTSLVLEVWHDSRQPVDVMYGELIVRELMVPWDPGLPGRLQ